MNGSIDRLFDSQALRFNRLTSDFETVLPHSATASLHCNDAQLHHCISNALIRNGVAIEGNASLQIVASDAAHIALNGKMLHSVGELASEIRKLK